MLIVVLNTF